MQAAVDAMKNSSIEVNHAVLECGIPCITQDRIVGRIVHDTKFGPKPYLTPTEEINL